MVIDVSLDLLEGADELRRKLARKADDMGGPLRFELEGDFLGLILRPAGLHPEEPEIPLAARPHRPAFPKCAAKIRRIFE